MPKIIERVSASRDKSVRSLRSVWHNQYLAQPLLPAKAYFCDFCDLTLLTSVTTRHTESELSSALAAPEVLCALSHNAQPFCHFCSFCGTKNCKVCAICVTPSVSGAAAFASKSLFLWFLWFDYRLPLSRLGSVWTSSHCSHCSIGSVWHLIISERSVRSVWHNQYLAQPLLPAKAYFCDFCVTFKCISVTII